jgi:hypothetical protein
MTYKKKRLNWFYVGFEVLTAVVMKNYIFWDIMPYSQLKVIRRFEQTCRFHLQGRRIIQGRNERDADDMFLRNVG